MICRICGKDKPKSDYYRKNATVCKPCANEQTILWSKNNPLAVKLIKRKVKLKEKYGLSLNAYYAMLEEQGGGCAICGDKETRRNLDVDHCHTTGIIRGILCESCNKAIGMFKDNPELLEKAKQYLEKYK